MAYSAGNFHGSDFIFHAHTVEVGVGAVGLRVELEGDVDVAHFVFELFCIDVVAGENVVFQTVECDGTIHGTGVYIDVANFTSQVFGHGALSARGKAVDCNSYLFHRCMFV